MVGGLPLTFQRASSILSGAKWMLSPQYVRIQLPWDKTSLGPNTWPMKQISDKESPRSPKKALSPWGFLSGRSSNLPMWCCRGTKKGTSQLDGVQAILRSTLMPLANKSGPEGGQGWRRKQVERCWDASALFSHDFMGSYFKWQRGFGWFPRGLAIHTIQSARFVLTQAGHFVIAVSPWRPRELKS